MELPITVLDVEEKKSEAIELVANPLEIGKEISHSSVNEQEKVRPKKTRLKRQKLWKRVPIDAVICKCKSDRLQSINRRSVRSKLLSSKDRKACQKKVKKTLDNALKYARKTNKNIDQQGEESVTEEILNPIANEVSFTHPVIGCSSDSISRSQSDSKLTVYQTDCVKIKPGSTKGSCYEVDSQEISFSQSETVHEKFDFVNEVKTKSPKNSPKAYLKIALNHMSESLGPIGTALKYMFTPLLGAPHSSYQKSPETYQKLMEKSKRHQPKLRAYFSDVPLYPKTEPLEIIAKVSLEEILTGCRKKIVVNRQSLDLEGNTFTENVEVSVPIPIGCHPENRIIFPREGDHYPRTSPGDLIFIIRENPHPLFWRQGNDLHYTARVTFWESLHGLELDVPTLLGGSVRMKVSSKQVFSSSKNLRLRNMGLPSVEEPEKRGDIIVTFDISRPHQLSS